MMLSLTMEVDGLVNKMLSKQYLYNKLNSTKPLSYFLNIFTNKLNG